MTLLIIIGIFIGQIVGFELAFWWDARRRRLDGPTFEQIKTAYELNFKNQTEILNRLINRFPKEDK